MDTFALKKGMMIGVASAATQIEGGDLDHSWNDWAANGHIADGTAPSRANDHYRLWREDAELMSGLGLQIYRFGIEWARVEPREGEFDEEVVAHYVEEARLLTERGIRLLVTLHHFTNPMWFERMGAFEKAGNIPYFLRFVDKMVGAFGSLVSEYITINEPNVYATNGYYFGTWPPGTRSFTKTVRVMSVMAAAHIAAYQRIHKLRSEMGCGGTLVSFANHLRVFAPLDASKLSHRVYARLTERFFQGAVTEAAMTGVFRLPLRKTGHVKKGLYCDFVAVNYYSRSSVSGLRDGVSKGVPVNDLGWEIYPMGIVECSKKLYNKYDIGGLPLYITENGTCDNADTFRSLYVYQHLRALCASDLPVARYYHWCFCDNFEWAEGETPRFGIVHIDYETQQRTVKQSGLFLRDIIASGGVSAAMYEKYIEGQRYNIV